MRLLRHASNGGFELVTFNEAPPPYATLSHTWTDGQEVSYQELTTGCGKQKPGYAKIRFCGKKAAEDGLQYFWVDTCCIDKSSSAELSESINSMYRWYHKAEVCYAYIDDWPHKVDWADLVSIVPNESVENPRDLRRARDFAKDQYLKRYFLDSVQLSGSRSKPALGQRAARDALLWDNNKNLHRPIALHSRPSQTLSRPLRWFNRGWTLQELLAPRKMKIFDGNGDLKGTKSDSSVVKHLSRITGIAQDVLLDGSDEKLRATCLGQRMSWAAHRSTTRQEDIAYCLLGIFEINMPLIYGEGTKAFMRLQEAILASSTDLSLLAWTQAASDLQKYRGIFSRHPAEFRNLNRCRLDDSQFAAEDEIIMTNKGARMETRLYYLQSELQSMSHGEGRLLSLGCFVDGDYVKGIALRRMKHIYLRAMPTDTMDIDYFGRLGRCSEQRIYLTRDFTKIASLDYERRSTVGIKVDFEVCRPYQLSKVESWPPGYFDSSCSTFVDGGRPGFIGFLVLQIETAINVNFDSKPGSLTRFRVALYRKDCFQVLVEIINESEAIEFKAELNWLNVMDPASACELLSENLKRWRETAELVVGIEDYEPGALLRIKARVADSEHAMQVAPEEVARAKIVHISVVTCAQATDFSRTLSSLKRSTLSIHNRLKSISQDASFVKIVSNAYSLPLVANERCGSWYIQPHDKAGSCYFKSTDGHTGEWAFSLRRLNVQVFDLIRDHGGVVIVDSTRRGKSMPDALMKTVPIWCAVFNRLLFPEDENAEKLYTPPKCVSASEHAQIEQRLDGFVSELTKLKLDVANLRTKVAKPLRPIWVTRESELPAAPSTFEDFHPIVLCTASKRVKGGEISEGGYIQGAGDDAEGWSQGLTPPIFWEHAEELMNAGENEIPDMISSYAEAAKTASSDNIVQLKAAPWLSIGSLSSLSTVSPILFDVIITVGQRTALPAMKIRPTAYMHLECRDRKLGSRDLRTQLPRLRPFLQNLNPTSVLICDQTGKDLAPGVALALLCLYTDDQGSFRVDGAQSSIDKSFIKQRLSWIMTSHPAASPSRTTLQSINDYLLTEHTKAVPNTMGQKLQLNNTSPAKPPAELIFNSLSGQWTLDRDITNKRSDGLAGKVTGTATFVSRPPTADIAQAEYLYREEGIFHANAGMQMNINRRWIWRLEKSSEVEKEPPSMSIHFVKADGETEDYLYNRLSILKMDASSSNADPGLQCYVVEAEHPCGRDFYVSKYEFYLNEGVLDNWRVEHEVKGPEKDYVSVTAHTKKGAQL